MINEFSGEYRWLSNFWSCVVTLDGIPYPTIENAYQAAKTMNNIERIPFQYISPFHAKSMGRKISLRLDWDFVKPHIMKSLLIEKFEQEEFREKLINTDNSPIIEGNTWGDVYWGVCDGKGKNLLGIMIMDIRADIHNEQFFS